MKTLKVMSLVVIGMLVASCNDDEMKSTKKMSSQEQAEMVGAAMGNSGFVAAGKQSAEYADDATGASGARVATCGYTNESSGSFSGMLGNISLSWSYTFGVTLACENEVPSQVNTDFTYEGNFDGPRLASDFSGGGSFTITQLGDTFVDYEINGTYSRDGSFELKIEDQATGSSDFDVNISEVMIDKHTRKIVSGTADVSVQGTISGKGDYSFEAHVVFHEDGTATITVSGDTYVMNIATGEITAEGNL